MVRRDRTWRERKERKGAGCLLRALLLIMALGVIAGGFAALWTGAAPDVTVKSALKGIGRKTPIQVRIDDPGRLEKVRVELVQGADVTPLAERVLTPRPAWALWQKSAPLELTVEVGRDTVRGLRTGTAKVRATAERAGALLRRPAPVTAEIELPVRLAPPTLGLVSTQHYVAQGGSEVVVYRVGDTAVRDGVRSGGWWFPGFPMPGSDKGLRFALYALPFDAADDSKVRLVAVDDVGNEAAVAFVDRFFPKPIGKDTIEVSDAFLNRVVPEILGNSPEVRDQGNLLANYLKINNDLRRQNARALQELGAKSAPRFLWDQAFQPMRNAAITAAFADRRTYVYGGKPVDHQVHLGFDMASVERDAIPSSNRGVVVLARYFGIYGNAVVVDHGYGLQSLYGHLSSIDVKEGQAVERGQTLGRSGQSGLAGGDHLHFTMLLQGLAVTPVEWWDDHWIQDRLVRKLGPALQLRRDGAPPPAATGAGRG